MSSRARAGVALSSSQSVTLALALALVVACFLADTPVVTGHPQCLDYLPPFPVSSGGCSTATGLGLGCCTRQQERAVLRAADAAVAASNGSRGGACMAYHANVSCAACHPFAAHIYDAGAAGFGAAAATAKPGLERGYW